MIAIDRTKNSQGKAFLKTLDSQVVSHDWTGTDFDKDYQQPKLLSHREISSFIESTTGYQTHRVLIAEHSPDICLLLRDLMEFLGLEVKTVHYGQDAIGLFQQWHPDLILVDLNIPVIDGLEVARQIRATAQGHFPAIIALCNGNEYRKTIFAAGYDDLVSKPFDFEVLILKLSRYLKGRLSVLGDASDACMGIEEVA
ncbi:MAG: response regulator [Leptolyngbyaceae cyanobacterium bins.59]|nr:response regulator [Leptolyngbyaceae cyanobacterium bins.59]